MCPVASAVVILKSRPTRLSLSSHSKQILQIQCYFNLPSFLELPDLSMFCCILLSNQAFLAADAPQGEMPHVGEVPSEPGQNQIRVRPSEKHQQNHVSVVCKCSITLKEASANTPDRIDASYATFFDSDGGRSADLTSSVDITHPTCQATSSLCFLVLSAKKRVSRVSCFHPKQRCFV